MPLFAEFKKYTRLPNRLEVSGALVGFVGGALMCLDAGSAGSTVTIGGDALYVLCC